VCPPILWYAVDFEQPRALWTRVFSKDAQDRFISNVAGHLGGAKSPVVKARTISYFTTVDADLGARLAKAIGIAPQPPLKVKPASEAIRFNPSRAT
jgi:catalase